MLSKKEEEEITRQDEDQVFGANDHATRINIAEREENLAHLGPEDEARRTRDILSEAQSTRDKLNSQKNEVRNYGEDARETPLA
ncbi:MAG: hypothetical protein E6767_02340 [Dysgonomonas sp.]|nr:hypothetical protein [Dysgonomonas sp.]